MIKIGSFWPSFWPLFYHFCHILCTQPEYLGPRFSRFHVFFIFFKNEKNWKKLIKIWHKNHSIFHVFSKTPRILTQIGHQKWLKVTQNRSFLTHFYVILTTFVSFWVPHFWPHFGTPFVLKNEHRKPPIFNAYCTTRIWPIFGPIFGPYFTYPKNRSKTPFLPKFLAIHT